VRSNFPENTDSGAQNFGPKQSEADDFLKSKQANPDTEVFGTDRGNRRRHAVQGCRCVVYAQQLHQLSMSLLNNSQRNECCVLLLQLLR